MSNQFLKTSRSRIDSQTVIHRQNLVPILPDQSREYLRKLWINEEDILKAIVPVFSSVNMTFPTDIFFFDVLPVLPPIVRPVSMLNGQMLEHPQTQVYKIIIQNCLILRKIIEDVKNSQNEADENTDDKDRNETPELNASRKYNNEKDNVDLQVSSIKRVCLPRNLKKLNFIIFLKNITKIFTESFK